MRKTKQLLKKFQEKYPPTMGNHAIVLQNGKLIFQLNNLDKNFCDVVLEDEDFEKDVDTLFLEIEKCMFPTSNRAEKLTEFLEQSKSFEGGEDFVRLINLGIDATNITDREFAEKMGASHITICRWASGAAAPFPDIQKSAINALRQNAEKLLGEDNKNE